MLYKSNLLTLVTMVDSWYIDEYCGMGPRGRFYSDIAIMLLMLIGTGYITSDVSG